MAKLTACFVCYLLHTTCGRTNPEARAEHDDGPDEYQFWDMILLLCYGAFYEPVREPLLRSTSTVPSVISTTTCGGLVSFRNSVIPHAYK